MIVDPSFVSKTSSRAVVYNVDTAGVQRKVVVGYSFCANHDTASFFDTPWNCCNSIIINKPFFVKTKTQNT